jgi:hypothetical protein
MEINGESWKFKDLDNRKRTKERYQRFQWSIKDWSHCEYAEMLKRPRKYGLGTMEQNKTWVFCTRRGAPQARPMEGIRLKKSSTLEKETISAC